MALGIDTNFDEGAFQELMDEFREQVLDEVEEQLIAIADECKDIAWGVPSWQAGGKGFSDVTGALRSSIGASVLRDGFTTHDNFSERSGTNPWGKALTGGNRGVSAGRALVSEVQTGAELELVVVAGMPYAEELQMLRGRDVLMSAELHASSRIDDIDISH